jgi:sulfoxide reductase heme-binding subunit YedZ
MTDSLLWYTTRGAGAVSLILLSGVVVLGVLTRMRVQAPGWPTFLTTGLHRNVSLLAVVFLALHIITAVVDPFTHLGWLVAIVPFSSYYRTIWLGLGTIAFELLAAVVITSLLRRQIGNALWRAVHYLAYVSWPVAVVHGLGTGTDALSNWFLALTAVCVGAVLVAVGSRLLKMSPSRTHPAQPLARQSTTLDEQVARP